LSAKAAGSLEAVRWLGNYGSHGLRTPLQKSDIFDGFDCVSTVVDELYEHRPKREEVTTLAKEISGRQGPKGIDTGKN
jgi:hypothetical protein